MEDDLTQRRFDAAPRVYMDRTQKRELGKYEDPVAQHHYVMRQPPVRDDLFPSVQAAWDDHLLYLRFDVRDERHVQSGPPSDIWKEDSIRVALTPQRDHLLYDVDSWTFIWSGYRGCELATGVALGQMKPIIKVDTLPEEIPEATDRAALISVAVRRYPSRTVYELAIDWQLIPDFKPAPGKSLGIWLVVHDTDQGELVAAEYGSSVNRVKRPTGFSAVRLVEDSGKGRTGTKAHSQRR